MANAWDKLRQARVQRFVVGWVACLAVLYAGMCVLVDLSAKSVLDGGGSGLLGLHAQEAVLGGEGDLGAEAFASVPLMSELRDEIAERPLQQAGQKPDVHSYYAGDCLVFYRVVDDAASGVTVRYVDCSSWVATFRVAKWALIGTALFTTLVAAALSSKVTRDIEREIALSEALSVRLLHEVKGPITALALGQFGSEEQVRSQEVDDLIEAFDTLVRFQYSSGAILRVVDAREIVFEVARALDKDAESSNARVGVYAPEPVEISCSEDRLTAVLYCIAKAMVASRPLMLFAAKEDARNQVGVSWSSSDPSTVPSELADLARDFARAEGCKVEARHDKGSSSICFYYV